MTVADAHASKNRFDVGIGYYSISAKTSARSGSMSGPGLYQLNYRRQLSPAFEAAVGYTVYFGSVISGDSGSGIDIGGNWFPFTYSGPVESESAGARMRVEDLWRPYVGLSFNQRNFQSVQSTYTGFGLAAGVERVMSETTDLVFSTRVIQLNGPNKSSGTEMNFAAGLGFKF